MDKVLCYDWYHDSLLYREKGGLALTTVIPPIRLLLLRLRVADPEPGTRDATLVMTLMRGLPRYPTAGPRPRPAAATHRVEKVQHAYEGRARDPASG